MSQAGQLGSLGSEVVILAGPVVGQVGVQRLGTGDQDMVSGWSWEGQASQEPRALTPTLSSS